MSRPRVCLFTLGGTIASVPREGGESVVPSLGAEDLVAAVPALAHAAELEATTFRQIPSGDLGQGDLLALDAAIRERFADGCAAAVVTQGTDAIEETAFTLDLLRDDDRPVVVTGAMRNPALPGADGPANLLAAVQVAAAPQSRDLGAVVVIADEIHSGRYVRKTHTASIATFRSETAGPLGWVAEGIPRIALRPADRRWIDASALGEAVPVALVEVSPGEDGRLLEAVAGLGYRGVVIEALGGGHVPARLADTLERLAETMPVVLASRTGSGEVLRRTYGFTGSEEDLLARGLIAAGALDGPKARALLALALSAGAGATDVRRAFEAFGVPPAAPAAGRFAITSTRQVSRG